jgi:hypothetical protein
MSRADIIEHDKAVTDIHQAETAVQSRTQAHQTAEQKLEQAKAQLDQFSHQVRIVSYTPRRSPRWC